MNGAIDPVSEKHYNVRNRIPNFLELFNIWATESTRFRQGAKAQYDLRYGGSPKSTLDLFLPHNASGLLPVHVFIHGGYWQSLDKSDFSYIAEPFINEGMAVIVVNYDLCPDVNIQHIVDQMRAVICWISEQGDQYGIDPHKIHLSGHSAGGHLVAELLATNWSTLPGHYYIQNNVIKSALALSGIFNLMPLVQTTVNINVGLTHQQAKALSPLSKIVPVDCPVLAVYGDLEGGGFEMQAQKIHEHWKAHGLSTQLIKLEQATHFDCVNALANPNSPVFQWALAQMK